MGKDKNNITHRRFAELAKLGEQVFHAGDLAVLWQIDSPNTLYVGLKRYTDAGLLFRVFKGLYSIKPVHEVDPVLLGMKELDLSRQKRQRHRVANEVHVATH